MLKRKKKPSQVLGSLSLSLSLSAVRRGCWKRWWKREQKGEIERGGSKAAAEGAARVGLGRCWSFLGALAGGSLRHRRRSSRGTSCLSRREAGLAVSCRGRGRRRPREEKQLSLSLSFLLLSLFHFFVWFFPTSSCFQRETARAPSSLSRPLSLSLLARTSRALPLPPSLKTKGGGRATESYDAGAGGKERAPPPPRLRDRSMEFAGRVSSPVLSKRPPTRSASLRTLFLYRVREARSSTLAPLPLRHISVPL